jgi:membrane protein insertase Oxa1/YidC/SpoIIIJ
VTKTHEFFYFFLQMRKGADCVSTNIIINYSLRARSKHIHQKHLRNIAEQFEVQIKLKEKNAKCSGGKLEGATMGIN